MNIISKSYWWRHGAHQGLHRDAIGTESVTLGIWHGHDFEHVGEVQTQDLAVEWAWHANAMGIHCAQTV